MKTIYISGPATLLTTVLSLLCAAGVFFDMIGTRDITSAHFALLTLFFLIPPIVWRRRIEIIGDFLSCQSWIYKDEIRIDRIERLNVTSFGHYYVMYVHKFSGKSPAIEFDIALFTKPEVRALLQQLQAKNPAIQIDITVDF